MLKRTLEPFEELAYTVLRLVAGLLFSVHGLQKLFGVLSDRPTVTFGNQDWFGGVIELGCGLLLALGLFTRLAAFLASGTMAVAYIQFHWKVDLDERFFPVVNHGELAVVYCFLFLYVACRGGGRWSLDARRGVA
jgi:putative oxidoreductase